MKKLLLFAVVISLILAFYSIKLQQFVYKKKVEHYLIDNVQYEKEDIQLIEGKWHYAGLPKYWVNVVFENEPTIVYTYFAHNRDVIQAEYYSTENEEIFTYQLKNLDTYDGDKNFYD